MLVKASVSPVFANSRQLHKWLVMLDYLEMKPNDWPKTSDKESVLVLVGCSTKTSAKVANA